MRKLRYLFLYAQNYKFSLGITVISMLLLVGVQLIIPWIIRTMIGAITSADSEAFSQALVTRLALIALAVYIGRAVLQFLRSYMAHIAGWGVVADARKLFYNHIQRLSLRYYSDRQTGQIMSRIVNDTDKFELLIAHAVPDIIVSIFTLIGVTGVLLMLNWRLTLFSLLPIPLIVYSLIAFARYVRPAFLAELEAIGALNAKLADNISGMREIKAFTRENIERQQLERRVDDARDSMLYALKMLAIFRPFIEFTSALGTIVVIYFGGRLVLADTLSIQDLVAFFLYLDLFYQPLHHLSDAWEKIQEALASADRVSDMMDEAPEIAERPDAMTLSSRAIGAIDFQNVTFGYLPDETVLDQINISIPAHATVALVGATGVGKTTFASLIPRFYDVNEGAILLDGHDLRALSLESLRQQISMVLQDVFLFHGTARENILFGRSDASAAEVIEAAKIANAHEFIVKLPDGYDTLIGERGVKLSGGQKQRLSIARAVLKDAPVLILDEATSSVDPETEALIQQALERLMVGRTTLIIAHRLSTVRNADQIVVLDDKHVAETGTHEQLMARGGLYWSLNQMGATNEPLRLPNEAVLM